MRKENIDFRLFTIPFSGEFGGEDGAGGGTSPLKTAAEIASEIDDAFTSGEPIVTPPAKTDVIPPAVVPPVVIPPAVVPPTGDFKPAPYWEKVGKSYKDETGQDFVMPEGLSAENEHEKFIEFLQGNLQPDVSKYHPFVQEVLQAAEAEDFDPERFIQTKATSKTYLDLPNEDFMRLHLKNINEQQKKRWTEEAIEKYISDKNPIELDSEATALKGEYRKLETENLNAVKQKITATREKEFTDLQNKRNKDITTLIEKNKSTNNYYGVTFSEADNKEFHKWLPDMLSINKETGTYPLLDYLRSDDNLMKIAAIVYKNEKGMRDYLTELKEGVKTDLMSKLRLTPNNDGGSITSGGGAKPIDE